MDDYLPLSMLNQLEYCERRFFLMHVRGEMEVNAHVLEGTLRHEHAHTAGASRQGETVIHCPSFTFRTWGLKPVPVDDRGPLTCHPPSRFEWPLSRLRD